MGAAAVSEILEARCCSASNRMVRCPSTSRSGTGSWRRSPADGSPALALPPIRQLAVDLGVNFHTVNKGYDLLRQEGLLRLGRKSGAVVRRDAGSGPPDSAWARDWTGRLQTLLAEAAAQGMPATGIVRECEAAMADFAFPAAAGEAGQGSGSPP